MPNKIIRAQIRANLKKKGYQLSFDTLKSNTGNKINMGKVTNK